ncbi:MAG: DUF2189 domain-containing protein [Hylemonella sp.]|uniref:DUF2189 domain-containing protein n=1 Tax=Hylemonella sp. TaxID=2066020 RepID=UPI0022C17F94|nr:DUF2189 domain-containing protein [Hylemonella sp.]MCZ8252849.1 DUF2189 domain-containing protein [Hylemonella sp.]
MNPASAAPGTIRTVGLERPLRWLVQGWHDSRRCGGVSFAHGLALTLFGQLLLLVAHHQFWLLAGAFSGLLVVGPVLATGLYALSRAVERGETVSWRLVLQTWLSWRRHGSSPDGKDWRLVRFGLLLGLAGTGWVLTSAALITLLSPVPIEQPMDFLRHVVLARDHWLFELWLALGGLMVAPIFASSAVALPLLLDRRVSVLQAVITSWEAVLRNPGPLALWAALIMGLTLLGLLTALLGLIVVMPVLGHASWHAYRELVDASAWPERSAAEPGRP